MAFFLKDRANGLKEKMEDPNCNRRLLFNTYRQFETINKLLAGWKKLYKLHIRPTLKIQGRATLLDIGFGGGDLPLLLHRWAQRDGHKLHITAIETDRRALDFVQTERDNLLSEIDFRYVRLEKLLETHDPFDFVISNHLLHHLPADKLVSLATQCQQLVRHKIIFNDLQRHPAAYLLFSTFIAPFFRHSFAASDGRRSIRRSYTQDELREILPSSWKVRRQFPFRLIATYARNT